MNCPTCPSLLVSLTVGAIELDECPRCLGMWFDDGELKTFLGARLEAKGLAQRFVPLEKQRASGAGACPRCVVSRLRPTEQFGQTLNGCGRCRGVWAPAGLVAELLTDESTEAPTGEHELPAQAALATGALSGKSTAAHTGGPSREVSPERPKPHLAAEDPHLEHRATALGEEPPAPHPVLRARKPVALQGTCPACDGALQLVTHQQQSFHRCGTCAALFFPRGGLPLFLRQGVQSWPPPQTPGLEPGASPRCPGCLYLMKPISLSGHPVRVYACSECWSMFASAMGVRRLVSPESRADEELQGPALVLWRMLDAFTDWIVNPPKSDRYSAHKPKYD